MSKGKRGRPSVLTPELQAALVNAVRRTFYLETACDMAGINRKLIYDWLKRGRKEKSGPYHEFRNALKKVLAEKEADAVDAIERAGKTAWQALAWLLERRHPDRWGSNRKEIADLKRQVEALIAQRGGNTEAAIRADQTGAVGDAPGASPPPP